MTKLSYSQSLLKQRKELRKDIERLKALIINNELTDDGTVFHDLSVRFKIDGHKYDTVSSYTLISTLILAQENDLYNVDVCLFGIDTAAKLNPSHTDIF